MGCSNSRSEAVSQLPIVGQRVKFAESRPKKAAAKTQSLPKPKRPIRDFHCPTCGLTKTDYPNYRHVCPGEQPVGYQEARSAICGRCEHSRDGVCLPLKVLHPDKPCRIEIGVAMPWVQCPLYRWRRTLFACDKCGSIRFNENGLAQCPVCNPHVVPKLVPIPPITDQPAQSKRRLAIITVAVGQKAVDLGKITIPRMRQYADFVGADFHVVHDNACPAYPLANKFRVGAITANYDRTLYLDADLWLRSTVGNVFELFPLGSIWMHPDVDFFTAPEHLKWMENESAMMGSEQSITPNVSRCYNSGVVLWDRDHASIWSPPPRPMGTRHVAEQWWVEHQALNFDVGDLPWEYNCQWYWTKFKEREPDAKIVHLANCPHAERLERLRKLHREDATDFI